MPDTGAVIFGRSSLSEVGQKSWVEVYAGDFQFNVDGWDISIYIDCDEIDCSEECLSPYGRRWSLDSGDRFGCTAQHLEHQTL